VPTVAPLPKARDLVDVSLAAGVVPAPYVFRLRILRLIQAFKLRRIGPLEFDHEQNPVSGEVSRVIAEHVQESVRSLLLDGFLVPRTTLCGLGLRRHQLRLTSAQAGDRQMLPRIPHKAHACHTS